MNPTYEVVSVSVLVSIHYIYNVSSWKSDNKSLFSKLHKIFWVAAFLFVFIGGGRGGWSRVEQ